MAPILVTQSPADEHVSPVGAQELEGAVQPNEIAARDEKNGCEDPLGRLPAETGIVEVGEVLRRMPRLTETQSRSPIEAAV